MAQFDLPVDQLWDYRPQIAEPEDFDAFWAETLAETRAYDLDTVFEPVRTGLTGVRTWDVTFAGFGGHPIKGWFTAPADAAGPLVLVVQYQGYNSGRSPPHTWGLWPLAGCAHFIMDTRGQGGGTNAGDTPDPVGSGPSQARAWGVHIGIRDCKTFGVTPDHGRCTDDQQQRDRGRACRAV